MFQTGPLYLANLNATEDIVVNQGGTSSGKTYAIMQVLFSIAIREKAVITVVGQDIPNLKVGAMRDAGEIVQNSPELQTCIVSYNKTDRIYDFKSGSTLEFKSYEDSQDAKSGKRDYLFVNEANGIRHDVFQELHLRTRIRTFIDYNPNAGFWAHTHYIGHPGTRLLISDHRHNPFLSDKVRDKIESIKHKDPEAWRVYARGLTGKIEGLVYRNWEWCEGIPEGANYLGAGLDFGFVNDVTAVVDVFMLNGELYLDELLYETGLINVPVEGSAYRHPNISDRLKEVGHDPAKEIVADSAEQKSITELKVAGWRMTPVKKGPNSVKDGITNLKKYKLNVTRRSKNIGIEMNTYRWNKTKEGENENEPVKGFDHALDATRYLAMSKLKPYPSGKYSMM